MSVQPPPPYIVNGADSNDPLHGGLAVALSQDAIQEFEVVSSGYRAEFGRAQGGVVNVVTRSGSNRLDGRTYWFHRNDKFDTSNVPDQLPPALSRHQWGGTIGGPAQCDRLFFFGSLERLDEIRGLNIDRAQVPTFVRAGAASSTGREELRVRAGNQPPERILQARCALGRRSRCEPVDRSRR